MNSEEQAIEPEVTPSASFDIYVAGPEEIAAQSCREFCLEVGLCVSLTAVRFIYTGGEETGVRVGLINYPRFPSTEASIRETAVSLGHKLMTDMHQHSFSVVGPKQTEWFSRRPERNPR